MTALHTTLGDWVVRREEACGRAGSLVLLVNRRDGVALRLTAAESASYQRLVNGARLGADDAAFADMLAEHGFLSDQAGATMSSSAKVLPAIRRTLASLDIGWGGAHRWVSAGYRTGAYRAFGKTAALLQVAVALIGVGTVWALLASGRSVTFALQPEQIPAAIGLGLLAIALHEGAHALVVVHYGGRVDRVGFRLHLGMPSFYVESVDALLLDRRQRMIQAAAGVWAEFLFTSTIAVIVLVCPTDVPLLHRFVVLNILTIASNLLPFAGLDGYHLFADAVRRPDLRQQADGALGRLALAVLAREPVSPSAVAMAVYSLLNAVAGLGLFLLSALVWWQVFGGLVATLAGAGPLGWSALAVLAWLVLRPAVNAVSARTYAGARTASALMSAIRFRAQWHWRIPAAQALGVQFPELDAATLGVLAGHVRRVPLSRLAGHHWCIATRRTATVIDRSVLAALADARV